MRLTFTERTIGKVRARANGLLPLFTIEARELLGVSEQVWTRLTRAPHFPNMLRDGLRWRIDAARLADFLEFWNRLELALRISEVARMCHTSTTRVRQMWKAGEFEEPLAVLNDSPRWERAVIESWLHKRYGDMEARDPRPVAGRRA